MSRADKDHFLSYKEQTRIKHQILSEYLPLFFTILGKRHNNLVYIDGFAGAGSYTDETTNEVFNGSPILALEAFAQNEALSGSVNSFFVEPREDHYGDLEGAVKAFCANNKSVIEPKLLNSTFQKVVDSLREHLQKNGHTLAPTFLFVDPCGVDGVHFESIIDILSRDNCEAFIFFNITGVQRIVGLGKDRLGPTLGELLGSSDRASSLVEAIESCETSQDKETVIIDAYCSVLSESAKAEYVLPFRIESEHRRCTSHYFIHATKHPLGFKIMKEIMWKAGKIDGTEEGRLELLQRSANDLSTLMRSDLDVADQNILNHLKTNGPTQVSVFRKDWPLRASDRYTDACYRRRLLLLENQNHIAVYEPDGKTPAPAESRKRYRGEPTLPDRLIVAIK